MRRLMGGVVAAGALIGFALPAFAAVPDGLKVAQANACMGCHAVDRKLVGPSFKDVAAKYKGDGAAEARLEKKVRDGGAGVWGAIPMPSHPAMSAADIHSVVGWVLAGAPSK
ncbi:c-type cytochrome [Paraburkholderia silvatlantica]|uniref:c-type cytochrome n=1 Tax=Paraburkholderia silvatlantica TaxID=321895 RepID=UPI0037501512